MQFVKEADMLSIKLLIIILLLVACYLAGRVKRDGGYEEVWTELEISL